MRRTRSISFTSTDASETEGLRDWEATATGFFGISAATGVAGEEAGVFTLTAEDTATGASATGAPFSFQYNDGYLLLNRPS